MSSIWEYDCKSDKRDCLNEDISVSTLVIGAGMAGLLTAYKLNMYGEDVVVVDSGTISSGQTKNTTAKITVQHDNIYSKLTRSMGNQAAVQYAQASLKALDDYKSIVEKNKIDCDFEILPSYLYSMSNDKEITREYACAKAVGIDARLTTKTELPFNVSLAVCFENQAQFSPLKFTKFISENLNIFENTRVLSIDNNIVKTNRGYIYAKNIVFACHYPFVNFPGLFFARMHQERSYVVALENAVKLKGMYKSLDKGGYSFRSYKNYLLMGGENHRTGKNRSGGRYDSLEQKAGEMFKKSEVKARWSAQDCMTADGVPYIGRYPMTKNNWYVATGFGKWGMTNSMVAANIISSMITGKREAYAEVFSPSKLRLKALPKIAAEAGTAVSNLCKEKFTNPDITLNQIRLGCGGIISYKGQKLGVYRKNEKEMYFVTVKCPHLGCQLSWNSDELSWDCPCHGSRFDYKGNVIDGPAQSSIAVDV